MYPLFLNEVTNLLHTENLCFSIYETEDDISCINDYGTNIMGHFTCSNTTYLAVWKNKQIAISARFAGGTTLLLGNTVR